MSDVWLRSIPFPYRCALAVCSDPDAITHDAEYVSFHRALRDRLGIKLSDGLFLRRTNRIGLIGSDGHPVPELLQLAREGIVDTIHTYGEPAGLPTDAAPLREGLQTLAANGIALSVWTNHSNSPFNLLTGQGDVAGSPYFHAPDLALYGVKYIWSGHLTPVWGQEVAVSPRQLLEPLSASGGTLRSNLKTSGRLLAKFGVSPFNARFRVFPHNRLLWPARMRDGTRFWEFVRFGPHSFKWDRFKHLRHILSARQLDLLIQRGACAIVYTHLGKKDPGNDLSNADDVEEVFSPLAQRRDDIWVAPTSRLLRYQVSRRYLQWEVRDNMVALGIIRDPVTGPRAPAPQDVCDLTFCSREDSLRFDLCSGVAVRKFAAENVYQYKLVLREP